MLRACATTLVSLVSSLLLAGSASAVTMTIGFDGGPMMALDQSSLGCTSAGSNGELSCSGSDVSGTLGGWTLDSWNLFVDPDPTVQNSLSVTNNTTATQSFVVTVSLPVSVSFGPTSLIRGSIGGSATDLNANGVTLGTSGANPIYEAFIDSASVRTLLASPQSFSNPNAFGTASVPNTDFGIPVQESVAQATTTDIALSLRFDLSAGDSAAFTSVFNVEPVPEPATGMLMGLGLCGVLLHGRRRRA